MKSAIFAVVLLTLGLFSLPVLAQQQDLQDVMNAANALSARESELLGKKDASRHSIALHIGWIVGDASPAVRI